MPQTWTITRELVLSIVMGLRKGLRLCHGMRRSLTEDEQFRVAEQIAAQLKLSNYKIEQGAASTGCLPDPARPKVKVAGGRWRSGFQPAIFAATTGRN